ncbi:unnamed protein product [Rhizophagus irregularis]|nr:unnamed protein product [Rhizophagus irregularis]CAB4430302.1 unnamed protein product [Rhizophagus irregularis]
MGNGAPKYVTQVSLQCYHDIELFKFSFRNENSIINLEISYGWLQSHLGMYSICNITRICEQSGEFASGSVATLTMSFYSDKIINFSKLLRKSK